MNIETIWGNREYPPVAFYFRVYFPGSPEIIDASFKKVSGLKVEMNVESVQEGGENRFTHQLPKGIKHGNLILTRGLAPKSSMLYTWVKSFLENDFSEEFPTKIVNVDLLDKHHMALHTWKVENAYPVKWEVDDFDSTKNEVVIETIEIAFSTLTREK